MKPNTPIQKNLLSLKSILRTIGALKKRIVAPLPRERGWGEAFLLLITLQTVKIPKPQMASAGPITTRP